MDGQKTKRIDKRDSSMQSAPTVPGQARIGSNPIYTIALSLTALVCVAHAISLPALVTVDGYWYAKLAEIVGTARSSSQWDYLRTPVFPAFLKLFFSLFGRQPMAVFFLQAGLGFGGICALGATLKRLTLPAEAAISVLLLSLFPTLVIYEHALLTEVGTFCLLALLLYRVTAPVSRPLWRAAELGGLLALGYYYRSSLLYISPVIALAHGLNVRRWRALSPGLKGQTNLRIAGEALLVVVIAFVMAYPWQHDSRVAARSGDVLLYGLIKQAVIPPSDPIWAESRRGYEEAIDRSVTGGRLPLSGVQDQLVYSSLGALHRYAPFAGSVLVRALVTYPGRYSAGFARTSLLFAETVLSDSDNASFRAGVLSDGGSVIAARPPGFPPLNVEMEQHPHTSLVSRVLKRLSDIYDRLVFFGFVATLLVLTCGLYRRDPTLIALGAIPIAFFLLNALVLASQDRVAVPIYPFFLVNLVCLPRLFWNGFTLESSAPPGSGGTLRRGGAPLKIRLASVAAGLLLLLVFRPLALALVARCTLYETPYVAAVARDITGLKRHAEPFLGNVDLVAGTVMHNSRVVIMLEGKSQIDVVGWAVDRLDAAGGGEVLFLVNGSPVPCHYHEGRPDVAAALLNSSFQYSGYTCHLPVNLLREGENKLQPILIARDDSYYAAEPVVAAVVR